MIIVRSPLRITLGGGGTDLPSYYRDHGGFLVAAAIDKYVYITLHKTFQPGYIVKYSELERVERSSDIKHPIVRAAIELVGADDRVEIASMADIPAGTGLGSSGSFTTALLRALHTRQRNVISPHALAEQACHIEIDLLREPVGKQDQFIAAYGGVTCFEFNKDDSVAVTAAAISHEVLDNLERTLVGEATRRFSKAIFRALPSSWTSIGSRRKSARGICRTARSTSGTKPLCATARLVAS